MTQFFYDLCAKFHLNLNDNAMMDGDHLDTLAQITSPSLNKKVMFHTASKVI